MPLRLVFTCWLLAGCGSASLAGDASINDLGELDMAATLDLAGPDAAVAGDASSASPFITTAGGNFMLNGKPFKWIGFDAYGMEGCYNGKAWTAAELDAYFSQLPQNGVTRIWAFSSYGTATIQTVLTEAAKYNQHVILVLGDDNASCGETDYSFGNHKGKTLQFYQSGWKDTWSTWVKAIVPLFKDNPQIMLWEVANEPGQVKTSDTPPSLTEWQAYFKGTSDLVRSLDPNHLVGMGANIAANFGGAANYETLMGTPNIDAVSFHDYSFEFEHMTDSGMFKEAKKAAALNNKPFYAGEAGVPSGATCSDDYTNYTQLSLASRVNFLKTKASDYFNGGIAGIMFWEYAPAKASWVAPCAYEMYPSPPDPMLDIVKNYVVP